MTLDKQKQLLSRLLEQTQKGSVEWQDAPDAGFQLSFSNSSVKLLQVSSSRGTVYRVVLLNASGDVADAFTDEDLDEHDNQWFSTLAELYRLAQRYARGADQLLDALLAELNSTDKERPATKVFIEPRPKGRAEGSPIADYVVEDHADQVLATFKTQQEAIEWAKRNRHVPFVSRVRHLNDKRKPDYWRAV